MPNLKIRKIDFLPSRVACFDNEEFLFFSGTSYLGIGHQAEFKAALMEGMSRYGTIFSASRNNNLQLKIYEETEHFLAKWTSSEAALTVTSGLLAGQLAVNFLKNQSNQQGEKTVFIYAPSAHPAVWERTPQYIFQNQSDFEHQIVDTIKKEKNRPFAIVSNAVDMLTCRDFDWNWIAELPENQDITLLIDDSHGIGVRGENGAGIFQEIKKLAPKNIKIIVIASLAKALGIPGGVILSDEKTIFAISQNPLFVGASPIIPAYLYAFLLAQPMYDQARQKLSDNIQLFSNKMGLTKANFSDNLTSNFKLETKKRTPQYKSDFSTNLGLSNFKTLENYPVFYTPLNDLFDYLFANKIFISHFAYPKPNDPPITRVVLSALHEAEDIAFLTVKINDFSKNIK
jgi:8-amino-7-oxononanoate synthase